jgi:hypothetical protein
MTPELWPSEVFDQTRNKGRVSVVFSMGGFCLCAEPEPSQVQCWTISEGEISLSRKCEEATTPSP